MTEDADLLPRRWPRTHCRSEKRSAENGCNPCRYGLGRALILFSRELHSAVEAQLVRRRHAQARRGETGNLEECKVIIQENCHAP